MKWIVLALVVLGFLIIGLSAEAECITKSVFDSATGQTTFVTECFNPPPTIHLIPPPDFTRTPPLPPIYVPPVIHYPDCESVDCE